MIQQVSRVDTEPGPPLQGRMVRGGDSIEGIGEGELEELLRTSWHIAGLGI